MKTIREIGTSIDVNAYEVGEFELAFQEMESKKSRSTFIMWDAIDAFVKWVFLNKGIFLCGGIVAKDGENKAQCLYIA